MTIYQGEELTFKATLRDDAGDVIIDLSDLKISLILKKDDAVCASWCNETLEGVLPITINTTTGEIIYTLPSSITKSMEIGAYTFEMKITDRSDDTITIGISDKQLKVCASSIGVIDNL